MRLHLALSFDSIDQEFTKEEEKLIEELYRTKYSRKDWTFSPTEKIPSYRITTKTAIGIITLDLALTDCKINAINLSGDFLLPNKSSLVDILAQVRNKSINEVYNLIEQSNLPEVAKSSFSKLFKDFQRKYQDVC